MSNRNPERWMNGIIGPDTVLVDGAQISPARKSLNLVGTTTEDDPDNDRTNVIVSNAPNQIVPLEGNSTYAVADQNQALVVSTSGTGPQTLTLPENPTIGREITVKWIDAGGGNTNGVTIDGNGAVIDGASTYEFPDSGGSVTLVYAGVVNSTSYWFVRNDAVAGGLSLKSVTKNVTLANLQALGATSNGDIPFNFTLPTGAAFIGAEVNVTQLLAGTNLNDAYVKIGPSSDPSLIDEMMSGVIVTFGLGLKSSPGTNPYPSRGGVTPNIHISLGGIPTPLFSNLTAGAFSATVYYMQPS